MSDQARVNLLEALQVREALSAAIDSLRAYICLVEYAPETEETPNDFMPAPIPRHLEKLLPRNYLLLE